jgi:hypothetical protein
MAQFVLGISKSLFVQLGEQPIKINGKLKILMNISYLLYLILEKFLLTLKTWIPTQDTIT